MSIISPTPVAPEPQWRSRTAAFTWYLSAIAFVLAGGCLLYASVVELGPSLRPKPREVARSVMVRNVPDLSGRRASFRILLFTDEFRWRLSSDVALENGLAQPEFTAEMKAVLNDAKEIICVGASSEEMPNGVSIEVGRAEEERRAGRRAEKIATWVRRAVSRPIPVRKLNIGHHTPTSRPGDTSNQRRVVIILVLNRDEQTNIDQALRSAMAQESVRAPIFDALLTQYSLAGSTSFAWVD
jgi:hypothetical protein